MDTKNLIHYLEVETGIRLKCREDNDFFTVTLPFNDNTNEPIELGLQPTDEGFILNDLASISGLLFRTGLHEPGSPGLMLVKHLASAYNINMDYNGGVLWNHCNNLQDISRIVNFIQAVTSMHTVIPALVAPKQKRIANTRLVAQFKKDAAQIKLPIKFERNEVSGKNMTWVVENRYSVKRNGDTTDVLLKLADLKTKEPQERAAYVLSLALDLKELNGEGNGHKDLRVVYWDK